MTRRTPKYILAAHRLITGRDKLSQKSHTKAQYNQLDELRSIFKDRNIIGLGIAEKLTKGKRTGELALRFYVKRKRGKKRLTGHKMIPPVVSIGAGKAILTDVYEMRSGFKALTNVQQNPIQSGFSVGTATNVHAGTLGAIVLFDNAKYMLSNSHVFNGRVNKTRIAYPAIEDNNNQINPVGILTNKVKLVTNRNRADAALARIDEGVEFKADIPGAAAPYAVRLPQIDMKVVGSGRTSGTIRGVVRVIDYHGEVEMPDGTIVDFVDQIACVGSVEGGDSGAIIVAEESGQIVGLLFAGSKTEFMFTPIAAVREELKVNFSFVNPAE